MKQYYNAIKAIPTVAALSLATEISEAYANPIITPTNVEARFAPAGTKNVENYSCDVGVAIRLTKEQYRAGDLAEYLVDVFASCNVRGQRQPLPIKDWDVQVYLAKKDKMQDPSQHMLWRTFTNTYPDGAHPVTELEYDQMRHLPATMESGTWVAYTAGRVGAYSLTHASLDEFEILGKQKQGENVERGTTFVYSRDGLFKTNVTLLEEDQLSKVTMPGNFRIKFKPSLTAKERAEGMHEDFRLCGAGLYNGHENKLGFYAAVQECLAVEADEGKWLKMVGEKPASWFMRLLRGTDARISTVIAAQNADLEKRIVVDEHGRPMEDNSGMVFHTIYDKNNNLASQHQFLLEVGPNSTSPVLAFGIGYLAGLGTGLILPDNKEKNMDTPKHSDKPEETEESTGTYNQGNETNLVE